MRLLFFIFAICTLFAAEDISGFWKSLDDDGNPQCVFCVYPHEGIYYGKIIGTYDENGEMKDTIYSPQSKAEGVPGNPHTCGLDIIYGLQDTGSSFSGKIIDPSKGKTYNCELWLQNGYLIVRGKVLMFGKNITWYPTSAEDFPKNFKMPDLKKLTPSVPQL
jgi:uncharacterized protein (DUF2147 family)